MIYTNNFNISEYNSLAIGTGCDCDYEMSQREYTALCNKQQLYDVLTLPSQITDSASNTSNGNILSAPSPEDNYLVILPSGDYIDQPSSSSSESTYLQVLPPDDYQVSVRVSNKFPRYYVYTKYRFTCKGSVTFSNSSKFLDLNLSDLFNFCFLLYLKRFCFI